ncbi:carboxymuconolactone decarboxylase family protein [Salinisphaera aquimarina]|uniref:Carboxymuconolactone decarboxylase family protein n=1 Tax=Salinisphaera aquimarina TaxID=2094031 RepID=A0ABV7EKT0_9GAMM
MKSKLPLPQEADLTPEQKDVLAQVLRSRKSADGPFLAWLHSPVLADRAQRLGEFCRYQSSLSAAESELLILCVAAHHDCAAEQYFHEPIARAAGLDAAAVDAVRERRDPGFADGRLLTLYRMAAQLLAHNRLDDAVRDQARQTLGETAFVEAVGIMGYYALVAYTLNAFEMYPDV